MAKKKPAPFSISKADLAKLPRNEQRRMIDLGYVQGDTAEKAKA